MTRTELHKLIKSVEAPDTVDSLSNGFYTLTIEEMLALCKKAQSQALRQWAKEAEGYTNPLKLANDMESAANELERKA